MELKNFDDFIAEAKDTQKSKVNSDLKNKDASHGDKQDILDITINEDDSQKSKENAALQAKDASHGDKPQVVKEDEDKEKVLHGEKDDDDEEDELEESNSKNDKAKRMADLNDHKEVLEKTIKSKLTPKAWLATVKQELANVEKEIERVLAEK